MVEIFAKIFQRADSAELKSHSAEVPHFKDTKLCKKSPACWNCNGIRYAKYADRTIVMLPQPKSTGKHYAYDADKPREVKNDEEDFEESKKVFFTPYLHTRLQYFGNDPALVVDLWKSNPNGPNGRNGRLSANSGSTSSSSSGSSGSSGFACNVRGPPPQNRVPDLLGAKRSRQFGKIRVKFGKSMT